MRVVILIQGRMGATRLPGKPLKLIQGRAMLSYQLERLRRVTLADQLVLATSMNERDEALVDFAQKENLSLFRGSEMNVLNRFLCAAREYGAEVIVRITADCPLISPEIVDRVIAHYFQGNYDYVANTPHCNFPRGMDVEVFSAGSFEKVAREASAPEELEHVTPYYYRHPELFKLGRVVYEQDISFYRWTVDEPEDFILIEQVFNELYPIHPDFSLEDLLRAFDKHPEWLAINAHVKQKVL